MSNLKMSIVIPAYNEEARIGECLTAIIESLSYYSYDTEIIVVNNASKDRTREVAASYPGVKIVDESRKGLVWARRAGFLASSGNLIANIDADTVMSRQWPKFVMDAFSQDPDLFALSGPYIYYDAPWYIQWATKLFYAIGLLSDTLQKFFSGSGSMLQGGNFVLRREALEKIGGYDTSIEFYGEDTDIGRRVGKIGKVKWTFDLPMYSSGRRFIVEGLWRTGVQYSMNFLSIIFTGKPWSYDHEDIRTNTTDSSSI